MKLKVCGLKYPFNFKEVEGLGPDYMGFIFYDRSPRSVRFSAHTVDSISNLSVPKVGVFVNPSLDEVYTTVSLYGLDMVQLHGDESPAFVKQLSKVVPVIKAFSVDENFSFELADYADASLLLFDAKGKNRGGNGIHFNWDLLKKYEGDTPFLLSGGLRLEDVPALLEIEHPQFEGIDVNSGFEINAGEKNIELLKELKEALYEVYS